MGKGFKNKFKKQRKVFEHHLTKSNHSRNIGKQFKNSPFNLGTKKQAGQKVKLAGKILQAIGTVTKQPEITQTGVGLEVTGDIIKGGKAKDVGARIGKDIGQGVAGPLGAEAGEAAGGAIGEVFSKKRQEARDEQDKTQHGQLKDQIEENQHIDDKEQHHNTVQLPNDLQATGELKSDVGGKLLANPTDVVSSLVDFEEDITSFQNGIQIIEFLVKNFHNFEHLADVERGQILKEALDTNLLNELLELAVEIF